MIKHTMFLTAMLLLVACDDGSKTPAKGSEGGECYGNGTCDGELICLSNLCVDPTGTSDMDVVQPDNAQPDNTQPDNTQQDNTQPDNAQPDNAIDDTQPDETIDIEQPDNAIDDAQPDETIDTENSDDIVETPDEWKNYAGLKWSPRSNEIYDLGQAKTYCETRGGRVPNINELRTIIINCPKTMPGGACQVSDPDCLGSACGTHTGHECYCSGSDGIYSALGDAIGDDIILCSTSRHAENNYNTWAVVFNDAAIDDFPIKGLYHVRCVK